MRPAALTVALGTVLVLAAATFDAEPLYVPGLAFATLGLSALAWVGLGGFGVRVERELGARTVVEEQPVEVRLRVRSGLVPLLTGVVDDPLLDAAVPLRLGQRQMTLTIHTRFARRGRRVLAPVRVVVRDPLGLATRMRCDDRETEVLVLPRVHRVTSPAGIGEDGVLTPQAGRPRVAAEVELDGVRPYRPGAAASRIHWSVFARTGELWERKLVADADARPLLVLDARTAGTVDPEAALDAAVRALASLTVALADQGGCSVMLPGDRRPTLIEPGMSAWPRVHVRLALVIDDGSAPTLAGVAGRSGPVLYVAARPLSVTPRVLQAAGGATRILVVPGTGGGAAEGGRAARRPLFVVAGCTGYAIAASRAAAA